MVLSPVALELLFGEVGTSGDELEVLQHPRPGRPRLDEVVADQESSHRGRVDAEGLQHRGDVI